MPAKKKAHTSVSAYLRTYIRACSPKCLFKDIHARMLPFKDIRAHALKEARVEQAARTRCWA